MRQQPDIEFYGGGPLDGHALNVRGREIVAIDDGLCAYIYRLRRDSDGTPFMQLEATRQLGRSLVAV